MTEAKLTITHGLPGSGKSTWAIQEVAKNPSSTIRVNNDNIRTELSGEDYHNSTPLKEVETEVANIQEKLIREGLEAGKHVIVDNVNLNRYIIAKMNKLAKEYNVPLMQKHFNVSIEEAKRRNKARAENGGRFVPEEVIDRFAKKSYINGELVDFKIASNGFISVVPRKTTGGEIIKAFNKELEKLNPMLGNNVVVVDVDGTLANNAHHADYAFRDIKKKDYSFFFKSIENAPVNEFVKDLANSMRDNEKLSIIVLTGRSDENAEELISFIKRSEVKVSRLIAKRQFDFRPDYDFKNEILDELEQEGIVIVHSIDDRPQSIQVYESRGIIVSKVEFPARGRVVDNIIPEPYETPTVETLYGTGHCIRCGKKLKNGGNLGPNCAIKRGK